MKNLNFEIKSGERIGIVGRTEAGKSTLSTALFRLSELKNGKIEISGKDISKLNLKILRNGITIIPQEPMLFSESIR